MSMTDRKTVRRGAALSSDATLGIVGCCLAAASATFGVAMTMHGPSSELGKSGNFTVFAQMSAPRARPSINGPIEDLDRTETASIPIREGAILTGESARIKGVTLRSATAEDAVIVIDGRSQIVRVGDRIDVIGEVLAIAPGKRPVVRTSRGLIAD